MNSKIFTIPNIISMLRIVMIPIFVILYFEQSMEYHYIYALGVLLLSGASDIVDGYIARHYNLISDIGKVLDPIADKLTQGVILFCLLFTHRYLMPMFIVLFVKEIMTLFAAAIILRSGVKPISSKWFGKLSTVMIYITMFYVIVCDFLEPNVVLPDVVGNILAVVAIVCMIIAMFGYIKIFLIPKQQIKTKISIPNTEKD